VSLEIRGDLIDLDSIHAHLLQEELPKGKRNEDDKNLFISKANKKIEEGNLTKNGKKPLSKEEVSKLTCI